MNGFFKWGVQKWKKYKITDSPVVGDVIFVTPLLTCEQFAINWNCAVFFIEIKTTWYTKYFML